MIKVVFCCFTHRCLGNYAPLLHMIEGKGGEVCLVTFPRLCDPDHQGLYSTPFTVRSTYPIDPDGRLISGTLEQIICDIGSPDCLLLGTCHLGPERVIGGSATARYVVGLQHGFHQNWEQYNQNSTIPTMGVFGREFANKLDKPSIVLGLPKLDLVESLEQNPDGDIVFAGQYSNFPEALRRALDDLQRISGKQVLVRPHPEGREHLAMLRSSFAFLDAEWPLADCLKRAALIVTTGSTVALEAMVANVPVVVIPDCHGSEYNPAGVVAANISGAAIMDIWRTTPDRLALTERFLDGYTGSDKNNRTERAYLSLVNLVQHL